MIPSHRNRYLLILIPLFIQKHLSYSIVNIEKYCKDKELEACALRLDFLSFKICVITVYRSPVQACTGIALLLHNY
jgi:hypothetical protein